MDRSSRRLLRTVSWGFYGEDVALHARLTSECMVPDVCLSVQILSSVSAEGMTRNAHIGQSSCVPSSCVLRGETTSLSVWEVRHRRLQLGSERSHTAPNIGTRQGRTIIRKHPWRDAIGFGRKTPEMAHHMTSWAFKTSTFGHHVMWWCLTKLVARSFRGFFTSGDACLLPRWPPWSRGWALIISLGRVVVCQWEVECPTVTGIARGCGWDFLRSDRSR